MLDILHAVANSPLQELTDPFPESINIRLYLKRDDLLHPQVSGNKWRKLKYNLVTAREQGFSRLLTFGGAYSNHLYATAAAGQVFGFETIGVVRGEELAHISLNSTLRFCQSCGMKLHFVSRADYRRKDESAFLESLMKTFGSCYVLPEGGTNEVAIQGTAEIIPELIAQLGYAPDYVCCPVGTGGTVAGLARSAPKETKVLGFAVLKGLVRAKLQFGRIDIHRGQAGTWPILIHDYHFGGYAKTTPELLQFIRSFEQKTGVLLEQVYTGKMLYGIYDLARQGYFPDAATVVVVHTGGLQGRSADVDRQ
jgi:1-aminocyclopropane-1-carboxylate deaminase/D-cysteine desulfhydrase-like pyridoxal-dependent ACC family enzyme